MTAPTTSIRTAVKSFLEDKLTPTLRELGTPGCVFSRGWPGDDIQRNHAWIDRVTGTVTFGLMMDGRKMRDDEFTVRIVFQCSTPGATSTETDAQVEVFYGALEDLIAENVGLSADTTVDDPEPMDGLLSCVLGPVDGPAGELTDEGYVSFMFAELAIHSRLS